MRISVQSRIESTPRVQQVRGMFDLVDDHFSTVHWDVDINLSAKPWHIGLITGPSGSGKSTVARSLFTCHDGNNVWSDQLTDWPANQAVVDGFPADLSIKDVTGLLSAVGFSSPPDWLRPYQVLSTGQRFRCDLARLIASVTPEQVAVFDEYTSVVDRTVAKIGSAAVAKTIRQRGLQFVAVTCHDDVIDWLQPDWVYTPATNGLAWRSLQRRPTVDLEIFRTTPQAWPLFAPHHYLSATLSASSTCFLATLDNRPVAFSAWINQLSHRGGKREHRTVVLPDFQGIGVGMAVSAAIASLWKGLGYRATSTTTHPAFIAARRRSKDWRMTRAPALAGANSKFKHATTRLTAGFEYIGPAMDHAKAQQMLQ